MVGKFGITATFLCTIIFSAELFPTTLRYNLCFYYIPPTTLCFSVVCVCQSVHEDPHVTLPTMSLVNHRLQVPDPHHARTLLTPAPSPHITSNPSCQSQFPTPSSQRESSSSTCSKLFTWTLTTLGPVVKQAVGLRLKGLLVLLLPTTDECKDCPACWC